MAKRKKKPAKKEAEKAPETKSSETPAEFSDSAWLVQYVITAKKEAKHAAKERRDKWEELWLLYQNKQDYTGKKSWQSKIFSPKIFMHTMRASALVERAVLQTSTLFKVEIDEEEYEESEYEAAREKARKVERKLKAHINKTNFTETYGEGTPSTFLLGLGADKRYWDADSKPEKCKYESIDVLNLFISPDFMPSVHEKPPHIIERKVMKLADLLTLAEKNPDVYIKEAVEKLQTDYATKQEIKEKERKRRGLSDYSRKNEVEILEFWGDIISKDGKHVLRDQLLMVANETELIRHHENSHDDKLPPYRLRIPIVYPHRGIAGTSLVEGAVALQYTLNNLLNLYMDNLNFTVNKMYEVKKTGLVDQQKASRIYPGKVFLKSTDEQLVQEVNTSPVGPEVINAIKVVDSELRQATAITEYVEALPSKHKQTLGEIEKKTAESHSFFDVIARRLERNSIGKLIEDTYNLLVQFSPETFKGLEGKYIFKVGGLTLLLQEEKLRQAIVETLAAVAKPGIFTEMTDIPLLWKKWLTHLNLQDVFKEPPEEEAGVPGVPEPGKTIADAQAKAKQDIRSMAPEEQMRLLPTIQAA